MNTPTGPFTGKMALIFDLDGTLVETSAVHEFAFLDLFAQYGIHDFDYSRYAGWRTEDVITTVLDQSKLTPCRAQVARMVHRCKIDDTLKSELVALGVNCLESRT